MTMVICALFLHFAVTYGMVRDSQCGSMSEAILFGDYCYQFNDSRTTWEDARTRCQRDGGDLLSITSKDEELFIDDKLKLKTLRDFWIGANDLRTEQVWEWSNGNPFVYLNWNPGLTWDARCGSMVDGNLFEGFCYQFNNDTSTWDNARTRCREVGGDLLSITSINEQSYIVGRLSSRKRGDYWIGANDLGTDGVWRWSNGDPYVHSDWIPDEPNNMKGEDCVAIMAWSGYRWNDVECNKILNFICKKKGPGAPPAGVTEPTTEIEVLGIRLGVGQIVVIIVGSVGALVILGVFICVCVYCRCRHIPQVRQETYVQSTVPGNNDQVYESVEMECYESIYI